jgi:hypothetical protein
MLTRMPCLAMLRLAFVCSVESDALLQSCVHSVHHLLRTIIRSPAAREPMLLALSRVLTFLLHSHAFVAEFFAAQWSLLHVVRDAQFDAWSVRILVELLRDSGAIVEDTTSKEPHSPCAHQQWYINSAQSKLVELLAQIAPEMTRDNQVNNRRRSGTGAA